MKFRDSEKMPFLIGNDMLVRINKSKNIHKNSKLQRPFNMTVIHTIYHSEQSIICYCLNYYTELNLCNKTY